MGTLTSPSNDLVLPPSSPLRVQTREITQERVEEESKYWVVSEADLREKIRIFLRLFFLPFGGKVLSMSKSAQMNSLRQFDLSRISVDQKVREAIAARDKWKAEL